MTLPTLSRDDVLLLLEDGEPLLLCGPDGLCHYANAAARLLLGIGSSASGAALASGIPPELLAAIRTGIATLSGARRPERDADAAGAGGSGAGAGGIGAAPDPSRMRVPLHIRLGAGGRALGGRVSLAGSGVAVHLHESFEADPRGPGSADEVQLRRMLDGVDAIVCYQEHAGAPVLVSEPVQRILGYAPRDLASFDAWDALIHPDDFPMLDAVWRSGVPAWFVYYRVRHAQGHWVWVADRGRWIEHDDGRGHGLLSVAIDATEAMEREAALRLSETRYRVLAETAPDAILTLDPLGTIEAASTASGRIFGWSPDELSGRSVLDLMPEQVRPAYGEMLRALATGAAPASAGPTELRVLRRDGTVGGVEVAAAAWSTQDGTRITAVVRDVEERLHAQADILRLATAMQLMTESVVVADVSGDITYVNPAFERITGYGRDEVVGRNPRLLKSGEHPRAYYEALWADLMAGRRWTGDLVNLRKDGRRYVEEASITPIRDADGSISAFVAVKRDVTAERAAIAALQLSEHRLRTTVEGVEGIIVFQDEPGHPIVLSPQCERLLGYRPGEIQTYGDFNRRVHPDDIEAALAGWQHPSNAWDLEYRFQHADGHWLWLAERGRRERFADGSARSTVSVIVDVTARRSMEAQLRQAQRLEAVGRLAGGVAHDMNNILAAISGYARFVAEEVEPGSPASEDIGQVMLAADRASALTRQLLAFSRRQPLEPRVIDVGTVVDGLVPMLGRLLGEHIEISVTHEPNLPAVRADPGQVEQVIVNLAVNARDAMPEGGRLAIRTSAAACPADIAARAGARCVRLEVDDTGSGMDEATLAQVFTPFFTTKELGRGTGLGLATVYGIVTGSGGRISVTSQPGQGTRFAIELPGVSESPADDMMPGETGPGGTAAFVAPVADPSMPVRQVLLVEDEPTVRAVTARLLESLGYSVVSATNGMEALALATRTDFDARAVITDVRMPGMQGTELVRRLRDMRPGFPAVFLSGYAPGAEEVADDLGVALLPKPCSAEALRDAVAAALDEVPVAG